jgi:hypothetical protein
MCGRGSHASRWLHWRCFPRIDNMAISGSYTFQVLTGLRVRSLSFLRLVFYWHTCRVVVGAGVTSSLDHVSYFYRPTWCDHNTPRAFLLLDHMSRCCTSACQYFIGSRVATRATTMSFLFDHVARRICTMYLVCFGPHILSCTYTWIHVSDSYLTTWSMSDLPRAHQSLHKK